MQEDCIYASLFAELDDEQLTEVVVKELRRRERNGLILVVEREQIAAGSFTPVEWGELDLFGQLTHYAAWVHLVRA